METNYKRTIAGSVGAGIASVFNASGRKYYILEHKTPSAYHPLGESQKIIVDQIELGRDSSCQVRFDESFETVSRRHAAIVKDGDNWKLIPLSQTNATIVNGVPVTQETILRSGDEIRLSSKGPVIGFIVPQGAQSMVKSIGLTERMNLFRKQALRPYKVALWVLAVVLVLSVGSLTAYNVWTNKVHQQEMAAAKEQIDAAKNQLDIVNEKADKAEQENIAAKNRLAELEASSEATAEELAAAKQRANNAQNAAYAARKAAENAANDLKEAQAKYESISMESVDDDESLEESVNKAFASKYSESEEKIVAPKEFENINDCFNAVYYVCMNDIAVYDKENREVVKFETSKLIGGTGFLLKDGRFVTAARVIEPWFYYKKTSLGRRGSHEWTFCDIQICANAGLKVVANYTAYSPAGSSFKFSSTEMTQKASNKISTEFYKYENVNLNLGYIRTITKISSITLYWHNNYAAADWAILAKNDQLGSVKGLDFDNAFSLNPQYGVNVSILGFPLDQGFENSLNIAPQVLPNNVNCTGLNDVKVIELSTRRWQVGNDGAPVLMQKDGSWTVIGILSHTDSADRDLVIPIASAVK